MISHLVNQKSMVSHLFDNKNSMVSRLFNNRNHWFQACLIINQGFHTCLIKNQWFHTYLIKKNTIVSDLFIHNQWFQIAGFLSFVSNEVSAFMVCLITLDRFLVLQFPFSHNHFRRTSAIISCAFAWIAGIILASLPLLPMTTHWEFYSQTGICIPLPITRNQFKGRNYAFGVMVALNFVLFLLIAIGQIAIFLSVKITSASVSHLSNKILNEESSHKQVNKPKQYSAQSNNIGNKNCSRMNPNQSRSSEVKLAYRLTSIVISDFLCWFPICALGIASAYRVPIPGELNVSMAIFILPLNSALNPFLYTLTTALEKRQKQKLGKIMRIVESKLRAEMKG